MPRTRISGLVPLVEGIITIAASVVDDGDDGDVIIIIEGRLVEPVDMKQNSILSNDFHLFPSGERSQVLSPTGEGGSYIYKSALFAKLQNTCTCYKFQCPPYH